MSVPNGPRSAVVVAGYSEQPEGQAAVLRALSEAALHGATLIVVAPEKTAGERLTALLEGGGVSYEVRTFSELAEPADELLSAAETAGADFIVIGLRRRSPVGKLLLGSNVQRVLLDAACPVLAVKSEG